MWFFCQRGSALITSLMLVAIVAASVTIVATIEKVLLYKTQQAELSTQAFELASGVEAWAQQSFVNYISLSNEQVARVSWPIVMPTIDDENSEIRGYIYDAQYLYNLNQVSNDVNGFSRLIQYVSPDIDNAEAKVLALNVAGWQSQQASQLSLQDESDYYASQNPPYRPAYRAFSDKSELKLVKGFSEQLYVLLSPYIIALPEKKLSRVNVNTAQQATLITLGDKVTPDLAADIVAVREENSGFNSIEEFFNLESVQKAGIPAERVGLRSEFFIVKTIVKYRDFTINIESLYQAKKDDEGHDSVKVLSRSIVSR